MRRVTPLRVALAGGVLLLASFLVLLVAAQLHGGINASQVGCVLGDRACTRFEEHVHAMQAWERVAAVVSTVAMIAIAIAAVTWPKRPVLVTIAALLIGCVVLLQLQELLDYASCDEPGYNDATLLHVAVDEWIQGLSVTWAPWVLIVVIFRYFVLRRNFWHWATAAIVAIIASPIMALLTAAADLC